MSKILYPECHGETYLHKIINPERTKVIHNTPGGVGWVLNQIKDKPDKKLIGIIDNDNSLPRDIQK